MLKTIPVNSMYVMLVVAGLLVLASLIVYVIKTSNKDKDYTELQQRMTSWWWMTGLLFVFLILGGNYSVAFFGFVSFLALKEFFSILPTRQTDRNVLFWAYLSIPLQYYWVSIGWYGMFIIFIPIYMFLFIPMRMVIKGEVDGFIKAAGIIQWSVMLSVFSLSHIAYLLVLPVHNDLAGGTGLVLYLLFMTQLNDISQYVWGKLFGRRRIIEKVSPNKTVEGFLGGLATITPVSSVLAPYLTPLNMLEGVVAGLIIGSAGFIGDVVISSVKRDLKIKDSGNMIPGHGGILDRMDSLLYTAPLFFHYVYYLYY